MDFELLVPLCKAAFINERPTLLTVRQYGQRIPKASSPRDYAYVASPNYRHQSSNLCCNLHFESPFGTAWALIAKLNVVTRRCREHFPTPPSPPRFALQKAGSLER
jgi:hypothetical protein